MTNPLNYKTQSGLIKALTKNSEKQMTVSLAWWFDNAKYSLITNFGWEDQEASTFVSRYHPTESAYRATT